MCMFTITYHHYVLSCPVMTWQPILSVSPTFHQKSAVTGARIQILSFELKGNLVFDSSATRKLVAHF